MFLALTSQRPWSNWQHALTLSSHSKRAVQKTSRSLTEPSTRLAAISGCTIFRTLRKHSQRRLRLASCGQAAE